MALREYTTPGIYYDVANVPLVLYTFVKGDVPPKAGLS